jgi:hemerythrin-like domain-containing protein
MDAISVLKADHRALQELCKKIKHEATIHEKAEEKFFYSLLKEIADSHIEEEENEFFPQASKLLSKEELEESGNKIIAYKQNHSQK